VKLSSNTVSVIPVNTDIRGLSVVYSVRERSLLMKRWFTVEKIEDRVPPYVVLASTSGGISTVAESSEEIFATMVADRLNEAMTDAVEEIHGSMWLWQ
jgi:hypothetical protein